MRLTIPEPRIKLYEDGFAEHDKLSREATGDNLSELVERIDDPLVIALDGEWGSGKSFFLKCWVGEHLKREENTTQTVYFDAFKHDFLDDPLIALTGVIADRFDEADDKKAQKAWNKAKHVAPALGRAVIRAGVSVVTAGLVTKADELAEAAINTASVELDGAVAGFWKRENGKRAAMEGFRQALIDLTEPDKDGVPARKLVIVVDELDRCRPDYALSLLEIVKHFFNVGGVHFVLGVNLEQLQNSVKARYGSGTEADAYLQKFYSIKLNLPRKIQYTQDYVQYFDFASGQLKLPPEIHGITRDLLERYLGSAPMTPRTIQRILTVLALIPLRSIRETPYEFLVVPAMLKICAPTIYEKMRNNELTLENLLLIFKIDVEKIDGWVSALNAAGQHHQEYFGSTGRPIPDNFLASICEDYLEVFDTRSLEVE
ncbi:KAP family P-loop NTPase fold protein [Ruegeria faecimaris]|uniref:KAP family P-loop NTPase fold protein n=1 Tax=Ruegeria faecimaris TaxID=686389 RepID=UPI0024937373|nr:P-loop NTPase fold protein [Ruegeria faecimaris]